MTRLHYMHMMGEWEVKQGAGSDNTFITITGMA